ncbi:MAG: 3-oxoacyl-[acyl-carrier-protein] reductase [Treponema sp.]|jgi:3-oxoacyl-[acyl-carrier protein] reductase|nr:3-oxoacyl-[acyl-carrier-protein] reductase [Treponema sp.]
MVLQDKKALVTGASRGIGRAITDRFLLEGAEVWGLGSREPADLEAWTARTSGKLHWISLDLSSLDTIEPLMQEHLKAAQGFDILVNNAGITKDNLAFRMRLEDFQKVLDVNLSAAFVLARLLGRDMLRRRKGAIINMSSVVGLHGNGGQSNYAASKAGLIGLTKSLAQETASRGIRVNAVAPGFIDSDMTRALPEEVREKMLDRIPLKRLGSPEEVAAAVLFLASDAAAYITGQVLAVDGGMFC